MVSRPSRDIQLCIRVGNSSEKGECWSWRIHVERAYAIRRSRSQSNGLFLFSGFGTESQRRLAIVAFCRVISATPAPDFPLTAFRCCRLGPCLKLRDDNQELSISPENLRRVHSVVHRKFALGCNPKQTHFLAPLDDSRLMIASCWQAGGASLSFAPLSYE